MDGNLTGVVPQRTMRSTGISVRNAFFKRSGNRDGVLFRHLCRYGAHFTGVDISENQIEQARRLTEEAEGNGA